MEATASWRLVAGMGQEPGLRAGRTATDRKRLFFSETLQVIFVFLGRSVFKIIKCYTMTFLSSLNVAVSSGRKCNTIIKIISACDLTSLTPNNKADEV